MNIQNLNLSVNNILNIVNILQQRTEYSEGIPIYNVPVKLKNLLNINQFYLTKSTYGVYVIFFPHNDTIYIGQSVNVAREVSFLRNGYRSQPSVNEAFKQSGNKAIAYAILQGPGLKEKQTRLNLEKFLIQLSGKKSINILGNKSLNTNQLLANPAIKRAIFTPLTDKWSKYGLHYKNLSSYSKTGCIYLFLHIGTSKFYIGESSNFNSVLKRHRSTIAQAQALRLQNQTVRCTSATTKMVDSILEDGVEFVYSIIENANNLSNTERKKLEENYRVEAFSRYNDRLYNPPTKNFITNTRKRSEESKKLNRIASLAQRAAQKKSLDLTSYPCIVDGIWYDNMAVAGRAINLTSKGAIKRRLLSPSYPSYIWLKNTANKEIPQTEEIKKKLTVFYNSQNT